MPGDDGPDPVGAMAGPVREWFTATFPEGPTPAQRLAWPAIASEEHLLLIAPTGTGKTLAAFLAILDRLFREHALGTLEAGLRCVYVSPLRSLGYDIERNLSEPLEAIRRTLGLARSPVTVGVRTGDTSASQRRKLRDGPPHLLITTPESLSLLLSQPAWHEHWRGVRHLIVDEVHALVPTKRGADLAVSLERLAAHAEHDPSRLGLSATCRPADPVARFLVGPSRACRVLEAPEPPGTSPMALEVESLLRPDEAPHRGLTYRRLLRRLGRALGENRTTVVFANTRALTEKITHDLRRSPDVGPEAVAAHHSALDADRRRAVEAALKAGDLKAVVTSTSLELGVDIGSADLTVQVGLPGGVARCVQRVGRSGHRVGATSRGLLLAATAAELAGAVVTARAAREGRVEPLRPIAAPLDVLCQQLIGMACGGEWSADEAFELIRKAEPMAALRRDDFDACLDFLAGDLAAPAGRLRARARRRAALDLAPDLEARGPVRGPQPSRRPLVLEQRRHDHVGGVGPRPGRRRGGRHARGGVRRAAPAGRSLRARRPLPGVPPTRWADRPCPGRRGASRTCLGGRATARRSRPSWRPTSAASARRPRGSWPTAPRRSAPGSARPTTSTPTRPRSWSSSSRPRSDGARSPARGRCWSRSRRIPKA